MAIVILSRTALLTTLAACLLPGPAFGQDICDKSSVENGPVIEAENGRDCFVFTDWDGPDIPVWVYAPQGVDRRTAPIAVIMHGARRDPDRYREEWIAEADRHGFVVVAPGFSRADFPRANGYNLGAMCHPETGEWRDEHVWSFAAIEGVFDAAVERIGSGQTRYMFYGNSAGS